MEKKGMFMTALLGMGTGAFLYSYCQNHPLKMMATKNKVKNMMMKDLK